MKISIADISDSSTPAPLCSLFSPIPEKKKKKHRRATRSTIYTSTSVHTTGANTGTLHKQAALFTPLGVCVGWKGVG